MIELMSVSEVFASLLLLLAVLGVGLAAGLALVYTRREVKRYRMRRLVRRRLHALAPWQ